MNILMEREHSIKKKTDNCELSINCEKESLAGSVSQRACVFCGARVVLNPITDALHLIHGPIGCASYTWDIRGSLSSGSEIYRTSYSTDMKEKDVIFGGETKLKKALNELIPKFKPAAVFVFSTCIVGIIGDDIEAICKQAEEKFNTYVIPVQSAGFGGNKSAGYRAACDAIFKLISKGVPFKEPDQKIPLSVNILGDFNLAAELWIVKDYLKRIGFNVVATVTGDGKTKDIQNVPLAELNLLQCSGSMGYLAKKLQQELNLPFLKISFFGQEDTINSLRNIAYFFKDERIINNTEKLIREEKEKYIPMIEQYKNGLEGKRVGIYVGGAFKAKSLIKAFKNLGMKVLFVGTQTGNKDDYDEISSLCDPGTIIADDTNPVELAKYLLEQEVDLLVGGVKERFLAHKLGIGFCDHNHERKIPLSGFPGDLEFTRELHSSLQSPIWSILKNERKKLYC
ncbi:nitrogenase iron-molybdenum cofactor biosynthesis protein NifE [Candidatus Desantisbacteria bacterium]|nr:nitrogenase iron-molybdenum cofactor biosynthesis protein NifE [Candidatus Desantisbacteria bacterium]